jgi:hypothetical protein
MFVMDDGAAQLFRAVENRRVFAAAAIIGQYNSDKARVFEGFYKF